ncbi:cuticle protein 16.5-like [Ixodes scapularis]
MIRACLILALATSAFAGYVNGGYGLGLGYGLGYGHALGYGHTLGYGHGLGYGLGLGYGHGLGFTHGLGYGHGLAYGHGLSYGGLSVAAPAVARTVSYAAPAVTKVAAIHAAPAVATYATAPAVTRVATYAAAPVATYAAPAFTKVAAVHAAPAVATYATAPAVTRVATYAAAPVATYAAAPVATVAAAPVVTRTVATSHVAAPVVGAYHAAPAVTTVAHAPAVATVAHAPALGYGYGVGHLGYGLGHYGYGHGLASYGLNYGYGLGTFGDYTTLLRKKKCLFGPEVRGGRPRPGGAFPCSEVDASEPASTLGLGPGATGTAPVGLGGDFNESRRSSGDVWVPIDAVTGRAGPLRTTSAYPPFDKKENRFFASTYGLPSTRSRGRSGVLPHPGGPEGSKPTPGSAQPPGCPFPRTRESHAQPYVGGKTRMARGPWRRHSSNTCFHRDDRFHQIRIYRKMQIPVLSELWQRTGKMLCATPCGWNVLWTEQDM